MTADNDDPTVVLFVDDDEDVRALHREPLRAAGFVVHEVATASDCIVMLRKVRPAVIVMDRELPDGDGFELVRFVKALGSMHEVLVIAHTAHALRSDVERAVHVGCDAFLAKPCPPDVLLLHIRRLLGSRK